MGAELQSVLQARAETTMAKVESLANCQHVISLHIWRAIYSRELHSRGLDSLEGRNVIVGLASQNNKLEPSSNPPELTRRVYLSGDDFEVLLWYHLCDGKS
jgi:hypothetical protein